MPTTRGVRTDAHSPANLKTENYAFEGAYDAHPTAYMQFSTGQHGQTVVTELPGARRARELKAMVAASTEHRHDKDGQCDHCGAVIRYRAVLRHKPTGQVIEVGEQCLDNRFSVATSEFKAMKKAAEEARAQHRIKNAVEAWVEANPDLSFLASEEATRERAPENRFVQDVARKLRSYGELSERQVTAVRNSLTKDAEFTAKRAQWAAERAAEDAAQPHAPCPTGRMDVSGKVLTVREPDRSARFPAWKMLVLDDRGFKVWGTVPNALFTYGVAPGRGDRVAFTAEVQQSDRDPEFGFYSRPSAARVVERAPVEGSGK
jgi:hypothetical protein